MRKFLFASAILLVSCQAGQEKSNPPTAMKIRYAVRDNSLIKEEYYANGKLKMKKFFTRDTIAKGAEIEYYPNGNLSKWKWFDTTSRYMYGAVYYDSNGSYQSFKGTAFIRAGQTPQNLTAVEMINPPNVITLLGYRDFYKEELKRQIAYEPALSDTTSWVTLIQHKHEKGHTYMLYFYFMDNNNKILDSVTTELLP